MSAANPRDLLGTPFAPRAPPAVAACHGVVPARRDEAGSAVQSLVAVATEIHNPKSAIVPVPTRRDSPPALLALLALLALSERSESKGASEASRRERAKRVEGSMVAGPGGCRLPFNPKSEIPNPKSKHPAPRVPLKPGDESRRSRDEFYPPPAGPGTHACVPRPVLPGRALPRRVPFEPAAGAAGHVPYRAISSRRASAAFVVSHSALPLAFRIPHSALLFPPSLPFSAPLR